MKIIESMINSSNKTIEELDRQDQQLLSTQSKLDNIYKEQQKADKYLDRLKSWFGFMMPNKEQILENQIEEDTNQQIETDIFVDSNRVDFDDNLDNYLNSISIGLDHLKFNAERLSEKLDQDKKILDIVSNNVETVNNKQKQINKRF